MIRWLKQKREIANWELACFALLTLSSIINLIGVIA